MAGDGEWRSVKLNKEKQTRWRDSEGNGGKYRMENKCVDEIEIQAERLQAVGGIKMTERQRDGLKLRKVQNEIAEKEELRTNVGNSIKGEVREFER